MKGISLICVIGGFMLVACSKLRKEPSSKTDYIPVLSAKTPGAIKLGQPITSKVTCGFYDYFADITFLNFEVKERGTKEYQIKAKAFYKHILYGYSLPVVSTFDTTLTIPAVSAGTYFLKFYTANQVVQTDTVQVN